MILTLFLLTALSDDETALREAVNRVSPCVVRIETVGGEERVGDFFTTPETTGVILTADGWVISSSLGFAHHPEAIFVLTADGKRHTAKLIMTDRNRKLTLLKMNAEGLPVPVVAPKDSFRVGQWTLTLGRVLDAETPSVTVGVLSAVNRIWGKAIQTDAAVSVNNYGGPLFDAQGRVLGILTPFSPESAQGGNPRMPGGDKEKKTPRQPQAPKPPTPAEEAVAGAELYDSGIAFAIPLEDIYALLPRMQSNSLALAGPLGVSFGEEPPIFAKPVISAVQPDSPAAKAGILEKDRILTINGHAVARVADVRDRIFPLYAGDEVKFVLEREGKSVDVTVTLEESK